MKDYWLNYHCLDAKIDHCTTYNENEEAVFYESIEELANEYSVHKIENEILFNKLSYKKARSQYSALLEHTQEIISENGYTK